MHIELYNDGKYKLIETNDKYSIWHYNPNYDPEIANWWQIEDDYRKNIKGMYRIFGLLSRYKKGL